jgi:putative transposase
MLQDRLDISERRACQITGQHRSTQRRPDPRVGRDDDLRGLLRQISKDHPRWGYRRAWGYLREQGWAVNRKKIQRLWREEGLRVPVRRRKRLRRGASATSASRLRAERAGQVWALDFQFDSTTDGRVLKFLHVVDEHTREALAVEVARSIDADQLVTVLERLCTTRRAPEFIRMDNGPEMTANAIRDWCRLSSRSQTTYIEPGSPWQNPFVESFGGRFRDEVLGVEAFDSLLEARVVTDDWRTEYNTIRPHSALGWRPPSLYAAGCRRGPNDN